MINHIPVLLKETVELLQCKKGGRYIDCTVGAGGHAERILELTSPDGVVVGIDQDEDILKIAEERLKRFGERVRLVHGNFSDIKGIIKDERADAILLDLGVSSYQLEDKERGFSFMSDAPLDMRMDKKAEITAADIVNKSSERELSDIIFTAGTVNDIINYFLMFIRYARLIFFCFNSQFCKILINLGLRFRRFYKF